MIEQLDEFMTTDEAARLLDLTPAALRRKARAGQLGAAKRGGVWWFPRETIEQYAHTVDGKALNDPTRGRKEKQPKQD